MSWVVSLRGFSIALLVALLSLLYLPLFVAHSSAVSPYDNALQRTPVLTADFPSVCSSPANDYDLTNDPDPIATLKLATGTNTWKTEIDTAIASGSYILGIKKQGTTLTNIYLYYTTTPGNIIWDTTNVRIENATYINFFQTAINSGNPADCDKVFAIAQGTTNQVISTDLGTTFLMFGNVFGSFTPNYPVGYEGELLFIPPPIVDPYTIFIEETLDVVNNNVSQVVAIGLVLGGANFVLQWFTNSVMSSRLKGQDET